MKDYDLELVQDILMTFKFQGKVYKLMEPTLEVILKHEKEGNRIKKDLEEEKEGAQDRYSDWLIREITHFVPEMTVEDASKLTLKHKKMIISKVFGFDEDSKKN